MLAKGSIGKKDHPCDPSLGIKEQQEGMREPPHIQEAARQVTNEETPKDR
jgi:hypothetical protein